jgi:glycosyltransferase involved in cell wall biosynthesis
MGHDVKVLRKTDYDPYGIYQYYKDYVNFIEEREFLDACVKESNNADIIHIHSRVDVLFYLKKKLKEKSKIVMHFHGSDLRGIQKKHEKWSLQFPLSIIKTYRQSRMREKNNLMAESLSDAVLISTPDLKIYVKKSDCIYLHNPVDIDHFDNACNVDSNKAFFTFNTEAITDIKWIINICKRNGINNLQVIDRMTNPIMYSNMPSLLKKFGIYVDIRYVNYKILDNLSKTALESLACGLKVLDYNLNYRHGLPIEHNPVNVVNRLETIYKEIL